MFGQNTVLLNSGIREVLLGTTVTAFTKHQDEFLPFDFMKS